VSYVATGKQSWFCYRYRVKTAGKNTLKSGKFSTIQKNSVLAQQMG
jgi:hypothetical protein